MRWSRISIDLMMRDMSSLVAVESRVSASAAAEKQSVHTYELQGQRKCTRRYPMI